jgi:hypothetical protein
VASKAFEAMTTMVGGEEAMKNLIASTLSTPIRESGVLERLIASAPTRTLSMPRRAGKSVMADMMITGYNSMEASTHSGGHEGYVDELLVKQGKPPKYGTVFVTQKGGATSTDDVIEDHMADTTEIDPTLAEIVAQYGDAFSGEPKNFSLTAPAKLITKKGTEYRHTPFIGGEEFTPISAYVGKKGQVLILLKPVDPSDFELLEVPEKQCPNVFGAAFKTYMREVLADALDKKEELAAQSAQLAERTRNADKFETYGDLGFGSW